ncbi:MAG: type II secretion system minor pseudopilin GspK [Nitrospinae bacterium]|nr:type II secretion system minor pseudopilin GspK [Nitrospinota bacterium]
MNARPLQGQDGMALILTITVVALLTIGVFDFFYQAWIQSALAAGYRDETKALYAARSGQAAAKLVLVEDARSGIPHDTLTEEWAQGILAVPIDGEFVSVNIQDESGKVDLNLLTTDRGWPEDRWIEIFRRLLKRLDMDENLCDALVDWEDSNADQLPRGAEEGYYLSLKKPYRIKNAKLDSVDELGLIKGFTPEVIGKLRPHVTVWSSTKINVNTATDMALAALDEDMTQEVVAGIIRERLAKPFTAREDIKRIPGMNDIYPRIALAIDVRSDYYSAETQATFGETTKTIRAVYRRGAASADTIFYKVF